MDEENPTPRASSSFAPTGAPLPPPLPPPPPPPPAPTPTPPALPPSSKETAPAAPADHRQRFSVELRPGETTIVSWKRLIKDSNKAVRSPPVPEPPPSGAHPALESRIAPAGADQAAEGELKDAPNRFSAVIEKIERLYMGNPSSDEEELDGIPDDDEYDTEDSFIDDAELDEYFQVDKSATKHNGFFVNRGKLERINEPISSPNNTSKKRRRKDLTKSRSETDGEHIQHIRSKHVKMGNVRMKAAARSASLVGSKLSSPSKMSAPVSEHYQDGKSLQNQSNASIGASKKSTIKSGHSSVRVPHKNTPVFPMETKDSEKHKTDVIQQRDIANKKVRSEFSDATHQTFLDKGVSIQDDPQSRKLLNDTNGIELSTKIRHREKNGSEFPDLSSPGSKYPMQKVKSASTPAKEGSSVRPKGTMLERAIRELENIVAVSRPPTMEFQEVDASSQGVKRRLPRDVKQKLAKVARLAQSSQGRISEELINRLMSILGHIVQLKTLKRNLKEMVELGLSAKQAKDDRFQQIKKEVIEMIRMRPPSLMPKVAEHRDGSSDDFQEVLGSEEKGALKGRYSMDHAMEDKICDLYDLYVEGMDEDKGPQSRKLYVELAELWPSGSMDNLGIKTAVYRAKERKRALYMRHKEAEKIKRRKPSPAVRMEETARGEASSNAQLRAVQERQATDTSSQAFTSSDRPASNPTTNQHLATLGRTSSPYTSSSMDRLKQEKVRGSTSMLVDDMGKTTDAAIVKKKVKRKPESDLMDIRVHSAKPQSSSQQHHGKERHKSDKLPAGHHQKSSLQPSTALPGCEQPS